MGPNKRYSQYLQKHIFNAFLKPTVYPANLKFLIMTYSVSLVADFFCVMLLVFSHSLFGNESGINRQVPRNETSFCRRYSSDYTLKMSILLRGNQLQIAITMFVLFYPLSSNSIIRNGLSGAYFRVSAHHVSLK